ncbi:MAG: Ig-like domain-containing protein [Sulfuritalea sp.]|nr:Ig-like domain-containing protein [Sulfuritalea sp.]
MSALTKFALPLMAMLGIGGCDYPKKIQEIPEPWQTLDPGVPRARFPTPKVLTEGKGAVIAPGDLVQLNIRSKSGIPGRIWNDWGNWWIWIGFRAPEETNFFSTEPRTASALVGLREGSIIEFVDGNDGSGKSPEFAGILQPNVFGDADYYSWRKSVTDSVNIYVSSYSTPSTVEIKRVCKGQAQYRTVRLFDDGPVKVCQGLNCYTSHKPREAWIDEAKIEAVCEDGRKVHFQYGPTGSRNGKAGRSPVQGYFDEWMYSAWKKIPEGVQFEGNHPPVTHSNKYTAQPGLPLKLNILANASDPDGNKLTVRIVKNPEYGKLAVNPDGTATYTPNPGWSGSDEFSFKASDGMVESDAARITINVPKSEKQ